MKRLAIAAIALALIAVSFFGQQIKAAVQFQSPLITGQVYTGYNGLVSLGTVITIANKKIQLPPDVYVDAMVSGGLCVEEFPCPEMPVYILRYDKSNDRISVGERTGQINLLMPTVEENERVMQRFDWLFDALPWQKMRRVFSLIEQPLTQPSVGRWIGRVWHEYTGW